jgi:hypothetical protein
VVCRCRRHAPPPPTTHSPLPAQVFEELQAERSRLGLDWSLLSDRQRVIAQRLAGQAAAGRLVLFLGSGVSAGCGLPTWEALLDELGSMVRAWSACTTRATFNHYRWCL